MALNGGMVPGSVSWVAVSRHLRATDRIAMVREPRDNNAFYDCLQNQLEDSIAIAGDQPLISW